MSKIDTLIQKYDRACQKVENAISNPFNYYPDQMRDLANKAELAGTELCEYLPETDQGHKIFAIQMLSAYKGSINYLRLLASQGDKMMKEADEYDT